MSTTWNVALIVFLTSLSPLICGDGEHKSVADEIVVRYGGQEFSQQDLSDLTRTLNVISAVRSGEFKQAFTLMFRPNLRDLLSSIKPNTNGNAK